MWCSSEVMEQEWMNKPANSLSRREQRCAWQELQLWRKFQPPLLVTVTALLRQAMHCTLYWKKYWKGVQPSVTGFVHRSVGSSSDALQCKYSSTMYWNKHCTGVEPSLTGLVHRSVNLCTSINFPPPAFSHTSVTSVLFAVCHEQIQWDVCRRKCRGVLCYE